MSAPAGDTAGDTGRFAEVSSMCKIKGLEGSNRHPEAPPQHPLDCLPRTENGGREPVRPPLRQPAALRTAYRSGYYFMATGTIFQGWARGAVGDVEAGLADMR